MGHVLVVEDDALLRSSLTELLEEADFTVTAVGDGDEALAALSHAPVPDVVLLDLLMPHVSGWQLLADMRRDPRLQDVPVVVTSALSPGPMEQPVDAVVHKPFDAAALLELVRDLAERRAVGPPMIHAEAEAGHAP